MYRERRVESPCHFLPRDRGLRRFAAEPPKANPNKERHRKESSNEANQAQQPNQAKQSSAQATKPQANATNGFAPGKKA